MSQQLTDQQGALKFKSLQGTLWKHSKLLLLLNGPLWLKLSMQSIFLPVLKANLMATSHRLRQNLLQTFSVNLECWKPAELFQHQLWNWKHTAKPESNICVCVSGTIDGTPPSASRAPHWGKYLQMCAVEHLLCFGLRQHGRAQEMKLTVNSWERTRSQVLPAHREALNATNNWSQMYAMMQHRWTSNFGDRSDCLMWGRDTLRFAGIVKRRVDALSSYTRLVLQI